MNNFFGFSLLSLAGEGSDYLVDTLKKCNIWVYVAIIVILINSPQPCNLNKSSNL